MDKRKWWLWLALPFVGLAAWRLFRNTSNSANRLTADLTNSEAQAALFYGYFGIVKQGGFAVATPVLKSSTLNLIGWLARNIDDWATVQRSFTVLCGGNYTILDAAKTALDTSNYGAFVSLVEKSLTQKRIFCGNVDYHSMYGDFVGENFDKNAFVGRCISEDGTALAYVSSRNGITYTCDKRYFYAV